MFEARGEIIEMLKKELEADKASTERKWGRQALYIERLAKNNRELYGLLEDHMPSLKPLSEKGVIELESGEEEEKDATLF